jgi:hypothetical protein
MHGGGIYGPKKCLPKLTPTTARIGDQATSLKIVWDPGLSLRRREQRSEVNAVVQVEWFHRLKTALG